MKTTVFLAAMICASAAYGAGGVSLASFPPDSLTTPNAERIGDQVLAYQRITGGWPKNIDMAAPLTAAQIDSVAACRDNRHDSTTDNNATTTQMRFLARLYGATGQPRFRDGLCRGVEYLLSGQYANGGWPQFWPEPHGYQKHITYNDGAMASTMTVLRDVAESRPPFGGDAVPDSLRAACSSAFDRGVECILATQIVADGLPTVWCQQHDSLTLAPAGARAYELPSLCSQESAELVWLLMEIENPDSRIAAAIEGAMAWFEAHKLTGVRYFRPDRRRQPDLDAVLVPGEPDEVLWGRFYDLDTGAVFVCDRDGIKRSSMEELGRERRNGYCWYTTAPAYLYPKYEEWKRTRSAEEK